jgi:hypothetical protein
VIGPLYDLLCQFWESESRGEPTARTVKKAIRLIELDVDIMMIECPPNLHPEENTVLDCSETQSNDTLEPESEDEQVVSLLRSHSYTCVVEGGPLNEVGAKMATELESEREHGRFQPMDIDSLGTSSNETMLIANRDDPINSIETGDHTPTEVATTVQEVGTTSGYVTREGRAASDGLVRHGKLVDDLMLV